MGPLFWVATSLQFVVSYAEQAARAGKEPLAAAPALLRALYGLGALAPALLLVHAFMTARADPTLMALAMGAVVAAVLFGLVAGVLLRTEKLRGLFAHVGGPLGLIVAALALYLAWPDIMSLVQDLQSGRAALRVPN